MMSLRQDVRYALRLFRRRPGFTTIAVITLALGLGANLTVFAALNATLLRDLPFPNPNQLVRVWEDDQQPLNPANYVDMRNGTKDVFSSLAAWNYMTRITLTGVGEAERVSTVDTTPELFGVIGVAPFMGRPLTPDDMVAGSRSIVVSHNLWRGRLGRDSQVIGRTLMLDGLPWTIVGVMPQGIALPETDVWRPLVFTPEELGHRNSWFLNATGRLRPDVSVLQADAALKAVMAGIAGGAKGRERTAMAAGLREESIAGVRGRLLFVQGVTLFVLLIACANLANLLMAGFTARTQEFAVRVSLGAGRRRLIRQLVVESLVLTGAGGMAGLVLATWLVPVLAASYPGALPGRQAISIGVAEVAAAIGFSVLVGIAFSLLPAFLASRPNLAAVGGMTRATSTRGARALRTGLLIAEVALALMLLSGAGLLIRSVAGLVAQPLGFEARGVLTAEVALPTGTYPTDDDRRTFFETLFARLESHPAVASASGSTALPFGLNDMGMGFRGEPADGKPTNIFAGTRTVTPQYLDALLIPLRRGRFFTPADAATSELVAVVNEAFVARHAKQRDVMSLRLRRTDTSPWITIVGVIGGARSNYFSDARAEIYFPMTQSPSNSMRLAIRTRNDPGRFGRELRDVVRAIDPNLPVGSLQTFESLLGASIAERTFNRGLLTGFAALAALLAAVGIYGVMSYVVNLRRREMGVRLALGARPGQVVALAVRQGLVPLAAGLGAGLAGAWWLTGLLKTQLFGITPHDPWTLILVSVGFLAVGALACWVPARRTGRVDPVVVLRSE